MKTTRKTHILVSIAIILSLLLYLIHGPDGKPQEDDVRSPVNEDVADKKDAAVTNGSIPEEPEADSIEDLLTPTTQRAKTLTKPSRMERLFWESLADAGDERGNIVRVMGGLDHPTVPVELTRKICTQLLQHPNLIVREKACYYLFLYEDDAALPVVVDMLLHPEGTNEEEKIKCQKAALNLLVQFKKTQAKDAILQFYEAYPEKHKLFSPLADMRIFEIEADVQEYVKEAYYPPFGIVAYINPKKNEALLEESFNHKLRRVPSKILIAWGMLRADPSNTKYLEYMKGLAQPAIDEPPRKNRGRSYNDNTKAFKYLASLKQEGVKEYLEEALDSHNGTIVEIALVNLLLRHGDSPKAIEKLKAVMGDRQSPTVSLDVKFRLAFEIKDLEVLQIAKDTYDSDYKSTSNAWWRYSTNTRFQSLYYWVDNHTINYVEEYDRP